MSFSLEADIFAKIQPREFLRRFISQNIRPDGRQLEQARQTNVIVGTITTANGSSQVRLGNTLVTCGIKLEVAKPTLQNPKAGYLIPNVDIPAMAHPRYKPGPPHELTQSTTEYLNMIINRANILDLDELVISENNAVWVIYADIVCLNYDGNIYDAALIALIAALRDMEIPDATYDEGAGVTNLSNSKMFALGLNRTLTSTTFTSFDGSLLMDPTDMEEQNSSGQISVTIDEDGELCGFVKTGATPLDKQMIDKCVKLARERGENVRKLIDMAFEKRVK